VGFYGGINYGFGYFGRGYEGGRWQGDRFYYNSTVNNINVTQIHNVYNTTIINNNVNVTRVSYNGGNGGVNARPTANEEAATRERHMGAVAAQQQHIQEARSNRSLRASENHGRPPIAATERPSAFKGGGVVAAKEGGRYNPPPNGRGSNANRPEGRSDRPTYVHPNDLPKINRPDRPPSTGNTKLDEKYQQQQDKLIEKENQERQKLQQKQDQEHQQLQKQRANDAKRQQVEQRHQQETQQLQEKHAAQRQDLQRKQQQAQSDSSKKKH
jgi:hypothetical protein